ncbi:MAG: AMIN domain-containing protein, partial [Nitrosopumilaceae archaeon]|nr:AMIN domain-containing protein [Nitrosopumilaceae archaeon]
IINRVRVGQFNESTSRVVIDLKKNVDFNISKSADSNSVVISLNNIGFGTNLKG